MKFSWMNQPTGWKYIDEKLEILVETTLPETNIAPGNGWLEYYFPIGEAYFQGLR